MRLNAIQYSSMQTNAAQYSSMQFEKNNEYANVLDSARSTMDLQNSVQLNAAQCDSVQCNADECSSIQFNTVQYSSIQYQFFENTKHLKSSARINAHSSFYSFETRGASVFAPRCTLYLVSETHRNQACMYVYVMYVRMYVRNVCNVCM